MKNIMDVQAKLNSMSFFRCENISVGDVLHYTLSDDFDSIPKQLRELKFLLTTMIFDEHRYEIKGERPKTITIMGTSFGKRKEHIKAYVAATDLIDSCIRIIPCERFIKLTNLIDIFIIIRWAHNLKKEISSRSERLRCLAVLEASYKMFKRVKRITKNEKLNIDNCVVWCDVIGEDNFMTQYYNRINVTTTTLSHAEFNINTNGYAYSNSIAHNFIVNSEYSKDVARKMGCKSNLIVAGSPHNIQRKNDDLKAEYHVDVIGLVLNGPIAAEANSDMVLNIQKYCKENGKKLILKNHPANSIDGILALMDEDISVIADKKMSVDRFCEEVDLVIVSDSTVFIESLYLGKPSFIYCIEHDYKNYQGIEDIFIRKNDDIKRIVNLVEADGFSTFLQKERDYFVATGDIVGNYKKAFCDIGINQ